MELKQITLFGVLILFTCGIFGSIVGGYYADHKYSKKLTSLEQQIKDNNEQIEYLKLLISNLPVDTKIEEKIKEIQDFIDFLLQENQKLQDNINKLKNQPIRYVGGSGNHY